MVADELALNSSANRDVVSFAFNQERILYGRGNWNSVRVPMVIAFSSVMHDGNICKGSAVTFIKKILSTELINIQYGGLLKRMKCGICALFTSSYCKQNDFMWRLLYLT